MTTFSIYKWEDGRLMLEYQNGAEHARLFFSPSSLSDLASCVSSALAEQNSRVMGRCKCPDHFPNMRREPICASYVNSKGEDDYCQTVMEDGACCSHERACHSTQSTDQEGK